MKKAWVVLLVLLFASPLYCVGALAEDYAETSGEQTATGVIYNGECFLVAIEVITDGTNDAKLIVYDALSTDGKVVFEMTVTGSSHYGGRLFIPSVHMQTGIYGVLSGTGASYIVEYKRR